MGGETSCSSTSKLNKKEVAERDRKRPDVRFKETKNLRDISEKCSGGRCN